MRLRGNECGACYAEKPGWQKPGLLIALLAALAALCVAGFAFVMLSSVP